MFNRDLESPEGVEREKGKDSVDDRRGSRLRCIEKRTSVEVLLRRRATTKPRNVR